jgi:CubicO group peptidase (beta-lactamase class C family)
MLWLLEIYGFVNFKQPAMRIYYSFLTAILVLAMISLGSEDLAAQTLSQLPRSTPEAEGVSSEGIIDFLNAADTSDVEIHSFMFIRHGKVIAEGWWEPYGQDFKHLLYSASKTFTATAVGLAVSENRLKVTDKVVPFFPYSLPDTLSDYIQILTVKDLLTMSVGQDPEPRSFGNNGDWITSFLETEPVHKPGTVFMYNNMATFMQSAIVQQVTGETVFDYLMPRIFKPLGIRGIDWDLNPQGINLGMIGLRLRTEDLAKFGQLLMNGGTWNKQQLIPEAWVDEATSLHIKTAETPDEKSDWAQGYAYQMWRGRNHSVRLDGMAGQFVVLFPDKDAIVVFTANARDTQKELNLMHDYLLPAIRSDKALASNPDAHKEVMKRAEALQISAGEAGIMNTDFESRISGKEFALAENEYEIQSVYFAFHQEECTFVLKRNNQLESVRAGSGTWKISNTSRTSLLAPPRENVSKSIDANYRVPQPVIKLGASYAWTGEHTLEITGRFVEESLGDETIVCTFSERFGPLSVTIEPKAPAGPARFPMMRQPVVLRGNLIEIK